MTAPMAADQPTVGELLRTLHSMQEDIRALRGEHIRRDLYEAHRQATASELARLASEIEARDAARALDRRMVVGSVLAAGLALVVQLVVAALLAAN